MNSRTKALEAKKDKKFLKLAKKWGKYGIDAESLADKSFFPFLSLRSKNDFQKSITKFGEPV